jgi:hypothetical protein
MKSFFLTAGLFVAFLATPTQQVQAQEQTAILKKVLNDVESRAQEVGTYERRDVKRYYYYQFVDKSEAPTKKETLLLQEVYTSASLNEKNEEDFLQGLAYTIGMADIEKIWVEFMPAETTTDPNLKDAFCLKISTAKDRIDQLSFVYGGMPETVPASLVVLPFAEEAEANKLMRIIKALKK